MQTDLAPEFKGTRDGEAAEAILRKCVHCGFCLATCPTYLLLGDERDSPRGRIYLMKQVVEGATPTLSTLQHLDRCLTCRNCETTCPSGVEYGHLVDVGRKLVEAQVRRPLRERVVRALLRETLTRRWLFGPAMRLGQRVRPLLPAVLRDKVPERRAPGPWPSRAHARKVLLLNGCTQPAMLPSIDAATARVLDRLGVEAIVERRSGCCGAIRHHLNDTEGALAQARRNIDAWIPHLDAGAEIVLVNASGCGAMVKEYAHLLRADPTYADKAKRVVEATRDPAEWLPGELATQADAIRERVRRGAVASRLAFHPPCTLQHGQRIRGVVESWLTSVGVTPLYVPDSHLCCGSAGTYSVLQPDLSLQLRANKLEALHAEAPMQVLSANIGCIAHLQAGTTTPVRHWVEWVDEVLGAPGARAEEIGTRAK
ncbi:MAG: glycolate oxidase subunit GlcF [Burkholderiaceae bacterium]|nr:glycolate oxidase subunit GlcF [Burkholderiaceae bacterium]